MCKKLLICMTRHKFAFQEQETISWGILYCQEWQNEMLFAKHSFNYCFYITQIYIDLLPSKILPMLHKTECVNMKRRVFMITPKEDLSYLSYPINFLWKARSPPPHSGTDWNFVCTDAVTTFFYIIKNILKLFKLFMRKHKKINLYTLNC